MGVVAAISAGGAGAVFWMWIMAVLGSATAFIEATLAQLYKEKTRFTAVIAVDRLIIFTAFSSAKKAGRKGMFCRRYYLPFRV